MSKVKKGWITFISLVSALFLLLGCLTGLPRVSAFAANKYKPEDIFKTPRGSSSVMASIDCTDEEFAGSDPAYILFKMKNGGDVQFQRDLALKWYGEKEVEKEGVTTKEVQAEYFSMRFAFAGVAFQKFTITFESAEENISKEGKSTNKIVFEPYVEKAPDEDEPDGVDEEENTDDEEQSPVKYLTVSVNPKEKEDEKKEVTEPIIIDASKDITITINEDDCEIGQFNVLLTSSVPEPPKSDEGDEDNQENENEAAGAALVEGETPVFIGKFENIGGYFLDYRATGSTTPSLPISFEADMSELDGASPTQYVLMKSLNNQSFELVDKQVLDNAHAVLVLNESLHAFKLGQKFSLSYEAIDVCDSTVTVDRYYYMLKSEMTESGLVNYMPNAKDLTDEEGEDGFKYSKYNYQSLTNSTYFLPSRDVDPTTDPEEYVAIRFKLRDDSSDNDYFVNLSWYAAENAVKPIECVGFEEYETEEENDKGETVKVKKTHQIEGTQFFNFIKVNRKTEGPYYKNLEPVKGETADKNENKVTDEAFNQAVQDYKDELALKAESTSAGTGAYIYLPSLRGLIASDNAGYRNLKFSIYYYKPGSSNATSQTSLNYNALKLEVDKEGWYRMRIAAQDASSNAMKYYLDEQLVTVTSSNIWDIEGIPEFEFYIAYNGPTIEKSEEQSLGYRNDTYNFSDFKIIALAGYQKSYSLYRYSKVNADTAGVKTTDSYSEMVKNAQEYFEGFEECDKNQEDDRMKILYEISVFQNDVSADDPKWSRTDNEYYWDPDSSLSFVPQVSGFYFLKVIVEDGSYPGETAVAYQVIDVRNPIDTIPGQSQWLQENVVSVVLFAISGVLAVIVVILFLIKPSDKKVEEVDLEKLKGNKKKKK